MSVRTLFSRLGRAIRWPLRLRVGRVVLALSLSIAAFVIAQNVGEARRHGNEAAAIGTLKLLASAQSLFREGDLDRDGQLDYARSLAALVELDLLSDDLRDGQALGYRFELHTSPTAPEFLWCASANPLEPGETGDRSFWTSYAGVVHYDSAPPALLRDDCGTDAALVPG